MPGRQLYYLLQDFAPEDIYNADETGLFFKLQPDRSLVYKGEDCRGGKRAKERITILPTSNMTGTDKLPLLVIHHALNPRIFQQKRIKHASLPVDYHANKNAWMTSEIFTQWLKKLDKKMTRKRRKIAMVVDNCRAHPNINSSLQSIKLVFLPPNTTSVTQPMDQGIIACMKQNYRRHLVQHGMLKAMDAGQDFSWNVLDAIYGIVKAWQQIPASTIAKCFGHCGFLPPQPLPVEEDEEDDIPLAELARRLRDGGMQVTDQDMQDYITVDVDVSTSAPMTIEALASEVMTMEAKEEEEEEDEPEPEPTAPKKPPTQAQMLDMLDQFKDAACSADDGDDWWHHINGLEKLLLKRTSKKKQRKIADFFNVPATPRAPVVATESARTSL